jgi:hypothetical protein
MSWMNEPDGLDKLRIELPNHPNVSGETLWAERLGKNLYEIRNVPFHAYGLNFLDVVVATPKGAGELPTIDRVHRRSGHRTIRICFTEDTLLEERVPTLMSLQRHGATFEGASQAYYAIDVGPDGNWARICDTVKSWSDQGLVTFETGDSPSRDVFDAPAVS